MTASDAEIIRNIRREFGKRPVDTTRLDVQVLNGKVTLGGTIAHLRNAPNVSLQAEVEVIHRLITRDRLVREVFDQLNYARSEEEKSANDHVTTRGRSRR